MLCCLDPLPYYPLPSLPAPSQAPTPALSPFVLLHARHVPASGPCTAVLLLGCASSPACPGLVPMPPPPGNSP